MHSVILVTVIPTMHLRSFKNKRLYLNPFALQFVESSGEIKCGCNVLRKMGKYS